MSLVEVLPVDRLRTTETALELAPNLTVEQWEEIGHTLGRANRASAWWIGDWINYGENAGYVSRDKLGEAERITELDKGTLSNYASAARRFELPRRRGNLTFGHHREVGALPMITRERLLDDAEEKKWSVHELRKHVPASKPGLKKDRHAAVMQAAYLLTRQSDQWHRPMTDALTPPQAKKQLTTLRKAHALLGDVIEAVEYRANTLHTFLGR